MIYKKDLLRVKHNFKLKKFKATLSSRQMRIKLIRISSLSIVQAEERTLSYDQIFGLFLFFLLSFQSLLTQQLKLQLFFTQFTVWSIVWLTTRRCLATFQAAVFWSHTTRATGRSTFTASPLTGPPVIWLSICRCLHPIVPELVKFAVESLFSVQKQLLSLFQILFVFPPSVQLGLYLVQRIVPLYGGRFLAADRLIVQPCGQLLVPR